MNILTVSPCARVRRATLTWVAAGFPLLLVAGCGEDLSPQIAALTANPECQALVTEAGSTRADITFFARATGGNSKGEPTSGVNAPLDMTWDFGDGQQVSNVSLVTHSYTQPGTYTVTVTVKDADGDADSRSVQVEILTEAEALTIGGVFNGWTPADSSGFTVGYNAEFAASTEVGCPLSPLEVQYLYEWDFGDGRPAGTGRTPVHRYRNPGVYDVQLRVSLLNTLVTREFTLTAVAIGPQP